MIKHTERDIGIYRRYLQSDCYTSRMFRIIIAHRSSYAAVNDRVKGIKKDRILYLLSQEGFGDIMLNMRIHFRDIEICKGLQLRMKLHITAYHFHHHMLSSSRYAGETALIETPVQDILRLGQDAPMVDMVPILQH